MKNRTKQCTKCKIIKTLLEFSKNKNREEGLNNWCKECYKDYYKENKEHCKNQHKQWRVKNKEKLKNYQKEHSKKYYEENKDKIRKNQKEYYQKNKEKLKEQTKKYRENNKNKYKKYRKIHKKERNKYMKHRRIVDINFRIACNYRTRIWLAIKNNWKKGHTIELLGCSINELRKYIESLFKEKMTWKNYGSYWEIDHIRPCSSFDLSKEEEQRKCFNYKNLQPLIIAENRRKGMNYGN